MESRRDEVDRDPVQVNKVESAVTLLVKTTRRRSQKNDVGRFVSAARPVLPSQRPRVGLD